jgi:hypothetical protein
VTLQRKAHIVVIPVTISHTQLKVNKLCRLDILKRPIIIIIIIIIIIVQRIRIIAKRISTHLEEQSLLPAEQKGCHPGSKSCKDQLMISKAIFEDCRRRNKYLSIAWTDYLKAFDIVPHSWVEKSIEVVGVNSKILRFCKLSMEKWNTRLFFKHSRR